MIEALYYLYMEGYIALDKDFTGKLTYKGILKISYNFAQEHKRNRMKRYLYNTSLVIAIISTFIGVFIALAV